MGFWRAVFLGPRRNRWENWQEQRVLRTARGELVASKAEKRIADVLHAARLHYVYEPKIAGFRPDFVLPAWRLVIEYWGFDRPGSRRRRQKYAAYKRAGYDVVNLESEDWCNLEEILLKKLYRWDQGVFHRYRDASSANR